MLAKCFIKKKNKNNVNLCMFLCESEFTHPGVAFHWLLYYVEAVSHSKLYPCKNNEQRSCCTGGFWAFVALSLGCRNFTVHGAYTDLSPLIFPLKFKEQYLCKYEFASFFKVVWGNAIYYLLHLKGASVLPRQRKSY